MTRAAPHIPLVVLADPLELPASPVLPAPARLAARRSACAVAELAARCAEACAPAELAAPLAAAAAATRDLADQIMHLVPHLDAGALPVRVPNHEYFGVRGSGPDARALRPEQAAIFEAVICWWALADLAHTMIDINDLAAEVAALRMVLAQLVTAPRPAPPPARPAAPAGRAAPAAHPAKLCRPSPLTGFEPTGDGLDRWIIAHHGYFMFNVRAAAAVTTGLHAAAAGQDDQAAGWLGDAAGYVRGFTAAMAHAAAMPASYYQRTVRPTMAPPAVPRELTGRTQPEHRAFRGALDKLLTELPQPYDALSTRSLALAAAREALLDADLADIERHVAVAAALVGSDHSLVAPGSSAENAVATLRLMRHLRAARYCPLTRFGDRFAADGRRNQ